MAALHQHRLLDGSMEQWDDASQTYTHLAVDGVTVLATRAYNANEQAMAQAAQNNANQQSITTKMQNAVAINQTFLNIASPTNTQNAAQIQALTKMVNALLKDALSDFSSTTGT